MNTNNSKIDNMFAKFAPWLLMLAGILLIVLFFQIGDTSKQVQETSAYTRVSNCIVSTSADVRVTQAEVERCYVDVEKRTGVKLERFDIKGRGENK